MQLYSLRRALSLFILVPLSACAEDGAERPGAPNDSGLMADAASSTPGEGGADADAQSANDASLPNTAADGSLSGLDAQTPEDAALPPPDATRKVYEDRGNGTVRDPVTGLLWQQTIAPQRFSWQAAKTYCSQLMLDGAGWRLPTRDELATIIDRTQQPAIDMVAFPGTPPKDFWSSSTSVLEGPDFIDGLSFSDGSSYSAPPNNEYYARCVR